MDLRWMMQGAGFADGRNGFCVRMAFYVAGMLHCAVGVAFIFHTYLAQEVYELFVKEVSQEGISALADTKPVCLRQLPLGSSCPFRSRTFPL
jgi:hypothetical protein